MIAPFPSRQEMTDMNGSHGFPEKMMYVLGASIVLIIAVITRHQGYNFSDYEVYALSVGAVAGALAILSLILLQIQPSSMRGEAMRIGSTSVDVQQFIAGFLCFWWFVGTSIVTFKAPFTDTSNGYFAAWVGLFASAMALGETARFTADKAARGATISLLFAALVVVVAVAMVHDTEYKRTAMSDESIFGVISACFTIFCCLLMLCVPHSIPQVAHKVFAIILALLWMATAGVLTFRSPFIVTGNGYFGAWAGLVFACTLFSEVVFTPSVQVHHNHPCGVEAGGLRLGKPTSALSSRQAPARPTPVMVVSK